MIFVRCLFILFFCHDITFARWGCEQDAPVIIEFLNQHIQVDETGKIEDTQEILIKILNEEGRGNYGTQSLFYNSTIEKVEILEAKTVFDLDDEKINLLFQGSSFKDLKILTQSLDKTMIEDRPVASQNLSFDNNNLITLSYPNAIINSWVYLKFKKITSQSPLPKYFATSFSYGQNGIWNKSKTSIKSKLPFKTFVHDLEKNLTVQESHNHGFQIATSSKSCVSWSNCSCATA